MTTEPSTDTELLAYEQDIQRRYNLVRHHLRMAANELLTIGREYGLEYREEAAHGVEDDTVLTTIYQAHQQVKFDRDRLIEMVQVMCS